VGYIATMSTLFHNPYIIALMIGLTKVPDTDTTDYRRFY